MILVDTDMPKTCDECHMFDGYEHCKILGKNVAWYEVAKDCPIMAHFDINHIHKDGDFVVMSGRLVDGH